MPRAKSADEAHNALYYKSRAEKRGKIAERDAACAAFDEMCARPTVTVVEPDGTRAPASAADVDAVARRYGHKVLRPPPFRFQGSRITAAQAALAEDIRTGVYVPNAKMAWDS